MTQRIPVAGPWITEKEVAYVSATVAGAWYANANIYHERFEKAFAGYVGVRYAMALPSCTSAIHLSLLALGVGPGGEVIVPEVTWIASAAPVSYVGATPVFADVDSKTWCLSAESLARCITPHTKAVIPVDLYGNVPDWDAIRDITRRHKISIVEDAAEAIGTLYKGKRAGSFGDTGVFSFHGSKTLTTGEGGMLLTDREDLYQRALILRDHGRRPGDKMFYNAEVAYKYKMSSMQAALGLAQLERIEELVQRKRQIFSWYQEQLAGIEGVTLNFEAPQTCSTYWMVTAVLDPRYGLEKERLISLLGAKGIDCRPFFYPLSSLPAYAALPQAREAQGKNHVAYKLSPYALNLPSFCLEPHEGEGGVCLRGFEGGAARVRAALGGSLGKIGMMNLPTRRRYRANSPTRNELMEVFLGPDSYSLVVIPPEVWNGMKGMSAPYAIVANCATHPHDPSRTTRLDPFSDSIPYKWEVKNF
jgi:perosamine synthetase